MSHLWMVIHILKTFVLKAWSRNSIFDFNPIHNELKSNIRAYKYVMETYVLILQSLVLYRCYT